MQNPAVHSHIKKKLDQIRINAVLTEVLDAQQASGQWTTAHLIHGAISLNSISSNAHQRHKNYAISILGKPDDVRIYSIGNSTITRIPAEVTALDAKAINEAIKKMVNDVEKTFERPKFKGRLLR